jgi:hypothetical protein
MDKIGRKHAARVFPLGTLRFHSRWGTWANSNRRPSFRCSLRHINALGETGRGVATFFYAAESFPTPLRGHYMGFAAAVGKAGAAIGTQVWTPIQNSFSSVEKGQQGALLIGSAFALVG